MTEFEAFRKKMIELVESEHQLMPTLGTEEERKKLKVYEQYLFSLKMAFTKVNEYMFWLEGSYNLYLKLKEELEKNETDKSSGPV